MAKAFISPPNTPAYGRLLRWAKWYGTQPEASSHVRIYIFRRMMAEVAWLTPQEIQGIRDLYARAAREGKEVDHIIGLADGGLHVLANLRLISVCEHAAKTRGRDQNGSLLTDDPLTGQLGIFK